MGNFSFRSSVPASKRVIWCDTEGGVRGVPLWDVAFIEECSHDEGKVVAVRFLDVANAPKSGRTKLRKSMPIKAYAHAIKANVRYMSKHTIDHRGIFSEGSYTPVQHSMHDTVKSYLESRSGCVLCAWNMRAHDKKVLSGAAGTDTIDKMVLWDALPWFRNNYGLPKNTLSSDKPGTPRAVFSVTKQGCSHTALVDAAHLREVVLRACYCLDSRDVGASANVELKDMFLAAQSEIEEQVSLDTWVPVTASAWTSDIPESVFKKM